MKFMLLKLPFRLNLLSSTFNLSKFEIQSSGSFSINSNLLLCNFLFNFNRTRQYVEHTYLQVYFVYFTVSPWKVQTFLHSLPVQSFLSCWGIGIDGKNKILISLTYLFFIKVCVTLKSILILILCRNLIYLYIDPLLTNNLFHPLCFLCKRFLVAFPISHCTQKLITLNTFFFVWYYLKKLMCIYLDDSHTVAGFKFACGCLFWLVTSKHVIISLALLEDHC